MENLSSANSQVLAWLVISLICPLVSALIFWWTVRAGQFSAPARSRFLPLTNCGPDEELAGKETEAGRQPTTRKEAKPDVPL